ncbi:MAG: orotate phosphoribosyltransferase [Nitrososphaerales archaeon]
MPVNEAYSKRVETLRRMIISKAIETKEAGFKLASGRTSNLYIDLRRLTQDPKGINLIGELVLDKIEDIAAEARYVGGLETAAIPVSTAVSLLSFNRPNHLKAFWVRKQPKDHGLQNKIEGNLEKGAKAVILDDTITTGGSSLKAVDAVREFGANVIQIIAIVDRGSQDTFEKKAIPFFAFFTESDLVRTA